MNPWIMLVAGIVLGAVLGFFWMIARSKKLLTSVQIESEGKIRAAESIISERTNRIGELQKSFEAAGTDKTNLLQQLRSESATKAALEAELRQTRSFLEDQSVLCDRLKTESELRVTAETQLAEAQTSSDTSGGESVLACYQPRRTISCRDSNGKANHSHFNA